MTETALLSPPHTHSGTSVRGVMLRVCLALVPALISYVWYFGWGIVIQCLLAVVFALTAEWLMLVLRNKPVSLFITDGSVLVTALLFALTISPCTPWWVTMCGIGFAVVFAKHLYGGLGFNPFNPAMAGYVFVLLCFSMPMNIFPRAGAAAPELSQYIHVIFSAHGGIGVDALSGASPLNNMKSQLGLMQMVSEIRTNPMYGMLAGRGFEIVNLAIGAGGILLLLLGVIRWRIPAAVLTGLFCASLVFYFYDGETYASPLFHLFAGGTMLAAFFIATDPVTAPATPRGGIYYGLLIGVITYIIRAWGGYPDGFAFAVLIANAASPLITHYTRPPVLGELNRDGG